LGVLEARKKEIGILKAKRPTRMLQACMQNMPGKILHKIERISNMDSKFGFP
jgi:hypothetical protein